MQVLSLISYSLILLIMKKYLLLSFLFLLATAPITANNSTQAQSATAPSKSTSVTSNNPSLSPTGSQVKNQNAVQTQNQGQASNLSVQNQEAQALNQNLDTSTLKVSDQVHQLLETVGAKGGIGPQVREIAQNQDKVQQEIKDSVEKLNSRKKVTKFFIGSDKKLVKSMEEKMEQNRLMLQQLEELKLETKNSSDLQQLEQSIEAITSQNTSLQDKVKLEEKSNGLFGWFLNFFNK